MNKHPFDQALRLEAAGSDRPDTWLGASSPAYWNMVGPFGGTTAATALQAVMQHPARLGEPIALTVNYAAALGAGPFTLTTRPVRTNRSTQHWTVEIAQVDASDAEGVVLTATIVTAARRETWSQNDMPMPQVPAPLEVTRQQFIAGVEWINRYDMRPVRGAIPQVWDGSGQDSVTQLWVRDDPPRALDFSALAAMADVFYPRVWLRRATRVPAGTVSITTYFHADSQQLAKSGEGYLLGQARTQAFRNGFFDQTAQLWNEAGTLLATSTQIVYYKE
jgi:acyl-CoA thioesterase